MSFILLCNNSSFQLPGFCMPPMLRDEGGGSDSDGENFEAVTPKHDAENADGERNPVPAAEKRRHVLEDVDGDLEMEDVAPLAKLKLIPLAILLELVVNRCRIINLIVVLELHLLLHSSRIYHHLLLCPGLPVLQLYCLQCLILFLMVLMEALYKFSDDQKQYPGPSCESIYHAKY